MLCKNRFFCEHYEFVVDSLVKILLYHRLKKKRGHHNTQQVHDFHFCYQFISSVDTLYFKSVNVIKIQNRSLRNIGSNMLHAQLLKSLPYVNRKLTEGFDRCTIKNITQTKM